MGAFPSEFGVFGRDGRGRAASADGAALVVLAVRADGDEWAVDPFAVGAVQGDVQVPAGVVDLSCVCLLYTSDAADE